VEDPKMAMESIKNVLEWKVISKDNILVALLAHNFDEFSIQYMGFYSHFLNKDLFLFSMMHGNTFFI
jgi:hypothetical protein